MLSAFPIISQHDSLSLPPTRAARKLLTNKLGRCDQPERPFCTLTRYTLRLRTALFTYMCVFAQVSGRETRVHTGRWHAGHGLRLHTHTHTHTHTHSQCITFIAFPLQQWLRERCSVLVYTYVVCLFFIYLHSSSSYSATAISVWPWLPL